MNTNVNEIIEVKELREQLVERIEVLEKVKGLLLLPNADWMNTKMVADYYEVKEEAVRQLVVSYRNELALDGFKTLEGKELSDLKSRCQLKSRTRAVSVFTKRAILRIGMLLRGSVIAKEVRTQLLNIVEKVEDQVKVADINTEQGLILDLGKAVASGDFETLLKATSNYNAFVNRRDQERLQETKERVEISDLNN